MIAIILGKIKLIFQYTPYQIKAFFLTIKNYLNNCVNKHFKADDQNSINFLQKLFNK